MMAGCISSIGEHLLRQTFSPVNNVAVTVPRVCKIMCIICRAKSFKYNLNNLIRQKQETNILFGPKLKTKTKKSTVKKERKTKIKNTVSKPKPLLATENHEDDIFVEIENEIICEDSAGDPCDYDENLIKDTTCVINSGSDENLDNAGTSHHSNVTYEKNNSKVFSKSDNSKKISKPRITFKPTECDENLPAVPMIDGLLKASLCPDKLSVEDQLKSFKSHTEKFSLRTLPTVTSILNKTQSELSLFYLERWKQEMIEELGEEGFKNYQEGMLRNGINLHANIQQFLSGVKDIKVQPNIEGYWRSVEGVLSSLGDILACEHSISHTQLKYKGTFDCVAVYKDCLCVIDWKTSQKPKPLLSNTFDSPIQVAAYVGAINSSAQLECGPVTNAAIVIAYPWGEPAHVHVMERKVCEEYWKKWLQRLHQYWKMLSIERKIL